MLKENLYKILNLPDFASIEEIKKAYRALAMMHHPDRGGDLEIMKKINAAYHVLSDKKAEYDARLRGGGRSHVIINYHYQYGDATNSTTVFRWTFAN